MGEWEMVRLGDVCEILDHMRVPVTASQRKKGIYPYYGANGIQDYVGDYIFDDELVLLAEDGGHFGSKDKPIAYRISGKCWVNNHAHVLKPKSMLNVDYLCYSIMFYDVSALISGTTRAKLNQAAMRKMTILLPPMPIQQKIANVLDRASALIEKRKAQIEKLDLLVKSKFIDMFGDPVANPMRWEVKQLGELGELNRGISKHRPRNAPELLGGKYPLVQTGEIAGANLYVTKYSASYSEIGYKQSKMWPKGTLCITIAANIAKTAILDFDSCFPDSVVGFIPNKYTNTLFIHFWFLFFQQTIEEQAPQSAQKNINLQILRELQVIVPSLALQADFANCVLTIEKQKLEMQRGLDELELLYKSFVQKYFTWRNN